MENRTPEAYVRALRTQVDDALGTLVKQEEPAALYDSVKYVLAGQGKRLRPLLVLLTSACYGVPSERALPAALATEVFHNFTLVHDDIMDHAETRRGRPTVHLAWDQSTAILCGDYLHMLSYDLLTRLETERLPLILRAFNRMVTRLCEGQMLDEAFETQPNVTVDQYLHMIASKTGALIQLAFELGGLIAGVSGQELAHLGTMGHHVGRAFQIQDDYLDLMATDARWGKTIGGDLMEGKKTLLLLLALQRAQGDEHTWFTRIVENGGLEEDLIPEARERMERLGVLADVREHVLEHSQQALDGLGQLPDEPARETLVYLLNKMKARLH